MVRGPLENPSMALQTSRQEDMELLSLNPHELISINTWVHCVVSVPSKPDVYRQLDVSLME